MIGLFKASMNSQVVPQPALKQPIPEIRRLDVEMPAYLGFWNHVQYQRYKFSGSSTTTDHLPKLLHAHHADHPSVAASLKLGKRQPEAFPTSAPRLPCTAWTANSGVLTAIGSIRFTRLPSKMKFWSPDAAHSFVASATEEPLMRR